MELLTIITKSLQVFSSFILLVIGFSFVAIKIKSRKTKKASINFSKYHGGNMNMTDIVTTKNVFQSDELEENKILKSKSYEFNAKNKTNIKIYAVYNPEVHPSFYLHNKLNWFKNID